jgi:LCP family protein required for cell wall assembly
MTIASGLAYGLIGSLERSMPVVAIPQDALGSQSSGLRVGLPSSAGEPLNILVIGTDTRTGQGDGFGSTADSSGFGHSDTTMLVHIAADRSFAYVVSIPRDSWITRPSCNPDGSSDGTLARPGKFNSAFSVGGPACVIRAVRFLTGIPHIDHFVAVDFKGFLSVVDAVGGVEICTTRALRDPIVKNSSGHFHGSGLDIPAGTSLLTGKQALAFVRARYVDPTSDIGRMKRQQAFVAAIIRGMANKGLLQNPLLMINVMRTLAHSVTVDQSLEGENLERFALTLQGLSPSRVTFLTVPFTARGDGENLLWDTNRAQDIWRAMKADRPWPPASSAVVTHAGPRPVHIVVLNGSGRSGLAASVAADLRSRGYVVDDVANSPRANQTLVKGAATGLQGIRSVLQGSVSLQETTESRLTLILGRDWAGLRNATLPHTIPSLGVRSAADASCID